MGAESGEAEGKQANVCDVHGHGQVLERDEATLEGVKPL